MKFKLALLQAINDWQIGGKPEVKAKRGKRLKLLAGEVDARFRSIDGYCFRRIALSKFHVAEAGETLHLPETISSWTYAVDVAKSLKEGVPDRDRIGVIFIARPKPEQVILNLAALYADKDFVDAIAKHSHAITNFRRGIGRWWNSQYEIVLEIDSVSIHSTEAIGGRSSHISKVAQEFFGRTPTVHEREAVRARFNVGADGHVTGWLSGEAKDRILTFWVEQALSRKDRRREWRARQLIEADVHGVAK